MRQNLPRRRRMALSGIVAALIMFVMLFTVGTGYFLWINSINFSFSQAQVGRNDANQAQQSEILSMCPGTLSTAGCTPGLTPTNHLQFTATNLGSSTVALVYFFVIDSAGNVITNQAIRSACSQSNVLNVGAQTPSPCDTGYLYTSGVLTMKVVTQKGNTFTTVYPPPRTSGSPSVITQVQPSSVVQVGTSVYDTASLVGVTGGAGGTVIYSFYSNSGCTGAAIASATVGVTSGNVPNSNTQPGGTQTASNAGSPSSPAPYSWSATYSGDVNNPGPIQSPCEPITVTPVLSTSLSTPSITQSNSVYDSATLSGVTASAGGTVKYYYSATDSCPASGASLVGSVAVTNGVVPNSPSVTFSVAGTYYWYGTYSGDSNNLGTTSQCEPLTVSPNAGATGSLTQVIGSFKFYFTNCNPIANGGNCGSGGNGLGDGVNARGYYGYGLSFTGATDCDSDENSQCNTDVFQITVTNQDPQGRSISLSSQSFLLLQGVCLSQDVCGGEGDFGAVFTQGYWIVDGICSPATTCTGMGAVPSPYSNTVTVGPGATVTLYFYCSAPCTSGGSLQAPNNIPAPGTYLSVSLNLYGLYSDGTPFGQDIPFISSYVSPVQIVGCAAGSNYPGPSCWASINPAQQLTGSPGGHITLSVNGFAAQPTNPFPIFVFWVNPTGTTTIVNAATTCDVTQQPCNVTFTIPPGAATGAYGLYVTTDGVNNAYATVAVLGPTGTATTLSHTTIPVGGSVTDSASLSGVTGSAGGTVTYSYYSGSSCQGAATVVSTVTVTNAVVPNSASQTFNVAGPFSWNAVYSGDGSNNGATSPCEPLTVQPASPSISTSLSRASMTAGQSVSDGATLNGATANAGGSVTYEYFNNNACNGSPTIVTTVTVTNGNVPSSGNFQVNSVGTYYFVAAYTGDINNNPATSSCGGEQLTVSIANPIISTSLLPGSMVTVGTTVSDSATLSGASGTAGGSVTYSYYSGGNCGTTATLVSTVTVTNAIVPNSAGVAFNTPGTYSWRATYTGDSNDGPSNSSCEPLTVKATTTTTVSCVPTTFAVATSSVCTATLSGFTGSVNGETMTWSKTGGSGSVIFLQTTCTLSGSSCSVTVKGTSPGGVTITASYPGDANNAASSGSRPVTVNGIRTAQNSGCSGTTCQVSLPGGTVATGDVLVITVDTFRSSSTTCVTVTGVADTLGGAWSAPGTASSSNSQSSPQQCAYTYINYKTASSPGGDTLTVTFSSSSYTNAVVVVYDLSGFTTPPSGGFVLGSSTIAGCNNAGGCGNPAPMSTSSLGYSATSFLIASGTTCNSVSGNPRSITQGVSGFTITFDTGLNQQEYVGYNVPISPGIQTFAMQSDSGSSSVACWTEVGAQFLDPPSPDSQHLPMSPTSSLLVGSNAPSATSSIDPSSQLLMPVMLIVSGATLLLGQGRTNKEMRGDFRDEPPDSRDSRFAGRAQ